MELVEKRFLVIAPSMTSFTGFETVVEEAAEFMTREEAEKSCRETVEDGAPQAFIVEVVARGSNDGYALNRFGVLP